MPVEPTSKALWGVDWPSALGLPRRLNDEGIELVASRLEDALPFIVANYAEIFESQEQERVLREPFNDAKRRFMQTSDLFEVKHEGRTIGLVVGEPSDWSTYYLRSVAFIREYQGRGLPRVFLPWMFEILARAGVHRLETETSPANLAVIAVLTSMRFNITGSVQSERWGSLLLLTKFLSREAEDTYLDKFCSGVRYQQHSKWEQDGPLRLLPPPKV